MIYGVLGSHDPSSYSLKIRFFIELALSEEFGDNPEVKSVITGCGDNLNSIIRLFCVDGEMPCTVISSDTRTRDDAELSPEDIQIIDVADIVVIFLSRKDKPVREIIARAAKCKKPVRLFELPVFPTDNTPASDIFDDDTDMESFCPRDPYADIESGPRFPEDVILFIGRMRSLCGFCAVIPSSIKYLNRCFDAYLSTNGIPHIFLNPETGNLGIEGTNQRITAHASFVLSLSPCLTAERRKLIAHAAQSGIGVEFITGSLFYENESMKTPGMKIRDLAFMTKEYLGLVELVYRITDCVKEKGLYLVKTREINPLLNTHQ